MNLFFYKIKANEIKKVWLQYTKCSEKNMLDDGIVPSGAAPIAGDSGIGNTVTGGVAGIAISGVWVNVGSRGGDANDGNQKEKYGKRE